jgi:SSS family solute:Na+ symporter
MNIYSLIILGYFAVVLVLGLLTRKVASKSASDYLIAGRNLGTMVCAVVVAAEWLGGMSTIGVSERAFNTMSLQPILYNISTALGMIVIGFTVAAHYRRKDVHTVSEMIEILFGNEARSVSAVAFLIAYIVLAYVQLQTCASVMAPLFNVSWNWAVVISAGLIMIYTYMGGMHALAITGILYLVTMFLGLGTAFFIGLGKVGGFSGLSETLIAQGAPVNLYNPFSAGISSAFALLLGGLLGGMAAQASIQPVFAARDVHTARKASMLAGLIVAPFGVMTAFLGLYARTGIFFAPGTEIVGKTALPTLLQTPAFIPPVLGAIAIAGVLAAILSTVGPVNFAVVTIAAKDIYHGIINKNADDARIISTARKLVLLVSLLTVPLAIFLKGAVLDTAYISYAIRAIGAIVIVTGLYCRKLVTPLGVKLAFIIGTLSVFVTIVAQQKGWFSVDKTYGAVATTIVVILLSSIGDRLFRRKA